MAHCQGKWKWKWRDLRLIRGEADKVAAATVTQRPVFFFFEARKKSSTGGLKMKVLQLLFGSFGYLEDPR